MCIVKKEVLSMKVKTFDFFKIGLGACLGWHAGLLIITAMGRAAKDSLEKKENEDPEAAVKKFWEEALKKPAYEGPVTEEENKKTEE